MYDDLVIGAGVSGLTIAGILSLEGRNVAIIDPNPIPGGMLQSFQRAGQRFDSSVHYVGALDPHQTLWTYYRYLGILEDLPLQRLNPDGFDQYHFPSLRFAVPTTTPAYRQRLLQHFPQERDAIETYTSRLDEVCAQIPVYNPTLFERGPRTYVQPETLGAFLDKLRVSPALRAVLTAPSYLYNVPPAQCPLHLHFLVLHSFLQSAWRIEGGSQTLADLLATRATQLGATVLMRHKATTISVEDRRATGVHTEHGEHIHAHNIISSIHPARLLAMMPPDSLRKRYRQRTLARQDGLGAFSIYLKLPPSHSWDHNVYWFDDLDTTRAYQPSISPPDWTPPMFFMSCDQGSLQGFTTMAYHNATAWCQGQPYRRSPRYHSTKQAAKACFQAHLQRTFPTLPIAEAPAWSATPLTYERYTNTHQGASYGLLQDFDSLSNPVLPQTRIPNLFLTGQSTLLPGVVGATLSAILTACQILGWDHMRSQIQTHLPT